MIRAICFVLLVILMSSIALGVESLGIKVLPDEVLRAIEASNRVLVREMREFRSSPAIVLLDKNGREALDKAIVFFEKYRKIGQSQGGIEDFINGLSSLADTLSVMVPPSQLATWRFTPPCEIESGDLVLTRSSDIWSDFFANASQHENRFSHIAVVQTGGPDPVLIETDNGLDGETYFCKRNWVDVCGKAIDCAVYRYGDNSFIRTRIGDNAAKSIGARFDATFDLQTKDRLYCAEMVRDAVNKAAGREVIGTSSKGTFRYVAIDDCYRNGFTKIFDVKEWKGNGALVKGQGAASPGPLPTVSSAPVASKPKKPVAHPSTNRVISIRFVPGK